MKNLYLKVFVSFIITLNFSVIFSQNVNPIKDYKSTFSPQVCDKLSRFLKENNSAELLCVNLLKSDNLSIAKADLILRNSLGLHPSYAFECFTYLYRVYGRKDMYYSLQNYLTPNELLSVDKCIVLANNELERNNKINETKQKRELKINNERNKKVEQDAVNNASNSMSGLFDNNSFDENFVSINLNDYGRIAYPNDSTDWNATEIDDRLDSVLNANNVFYKDNVGWVKLINKEEPVRNRIMLTNVQPVFNKDVEGKVTVNVRVNESGDVISTTIGSPTTISDSEIRINAMKAARKTKFTSGDGIANGSITYNFRLDGDDKNKNNVPNSKEENNNNSTLSSVIEIMPSYSGGDNAMFDFINTNLKYPKAAKKDKIQGKVVLRFEVTESGGIGDVVVLNSLSPECDNEAIRVVKLLVFTPAKNDKGQNVSVYLKLPVTFSLN